MRPDSNASVAEGFRHEGSRISRSTVSWALQLVVAGILLQTLFFKFTGAAESVYIFSTLGVEPWGRDRLRASWS